MLQRIRKIIPNALTVFRFLLSPFLVYESCLLFSEGDQTRKWFVFSLFLIGCITDWLDGKLARRWRVISSFGKSFDPLADKVLILGIVFVLMFHNHLSLWVGIPILARDILMDLIRLYYWFLPGRKRAVPAIYLAKLKTVFQMVGAGVAIVLMGSIETLIYTLTLNSIFGISMFFSVVSFIIYLKNYAGKR